MYKKKIEKTNKYITIYFVVVFVFIFSILAYLITVNSLNGKKIIETLKTKPISCNHSNVTVTIYPDSNFFIDKNNIVIKEEKVGFVFETSFYLKSCKEYK